MGLPPTPASWFRVGSPYVTPPPTFPRGATKYPMVFNQIYKAHLYRSLLDLPILQFQDIITCSIEEGHLLPPLISGVRMRIIYSLPHKVVVKCPMWQSGEPSDMHQCHS